MNPLAGTNAYRAALGMALIAALLLFWVVGAVGIIGASGDRADLLYGGVLAVGLIGALVARFRPQGMARTLIGMAVVQALVPVIALVTGLVPAYNSAAEVLGISAFFVVLFAGSAWLFRRAAVPSNPDTN